jgi:fructose-1,6-bisphosphatase I
VDAGIPTGTIFGVFETPEGCEVLPEDCDEDAPEDPEGCDVSSSVSQACLTSTLQPGSALVASGYCLYSSSTFFTLTIGAGVQIFTLDPQVCGLVAESDSVGYAGYSYAILTIDPNAPYRP